MTLTFLLPGWWQCDIGVGVTEVETLGGEKIEVIKAGSCVTIWSSAGTANVIMADVGATNGVIHVVDTVFWYLVNYRSFYIKANIQKSSF